MAPIAGSQAAASNWPIDTSGIMFNPDNPDMMAKHDRLMKVTDLVMLDIKHIDNAECDDKCDDSKPSDLGKTCEVKLKEGGLCHI